jgi:hypothetical protein
VKALAALLLVAGCGPPPGARYPAAEGAPAASWVEGGWKTMRAEHRARLTVGKEVRTLRGLIAVARPDRFRLRALGPAGITLFDVLYAGGEVKVLQSLQDPSNAAVGKTVAALAGDLAAAYGLSPRPAGRGVLAVRGGVEVREPGRRILLGRFVSPRPGTQAAMSIAIEDVAAGYSVQVDAAQIDLDVELDPALFTPP